MRIRQPKTKILSLVSVPPRLADAMRGICIELQSALRDRVPMDFDDALQVPGLVGGRTGSPVTPYSFTFFPSPDSHRPTWQLALTEDDLYGLADGRIQNLSLFTCDTPGCGMRFTNPDGTCFDHDYADDPDPFHGPVTIATARARLDELGFADLSATSTRADVIATHGPPQASTPPTPDIVGRGSGWIRYHLGATDLIIFFSKRGPVREVVISLCSCTTNAP